jgi:hypothetical protein
VEQFFTAEKGVGRDDGPIKGDKFWKFTPMINWFLSEFTILSDTHSVSDQVK